MSVDTPLASEPDPAQIDDEQAATNASVAGATSIIALGNIASRVLGLVRDRTLAYFFGASAVLDAYQAAIIIPKNVFDLLIGGHVSGAIVPVLNEVLVTQGREELWKVVNILMTVIVVTLSLLVIVIEIFAEPLVYLTAPGYDARTLSLATDLLRLTAPALLFMGLFAIFSGALFALKRFTWPAFAGVVFNASIVMTTVLFTPPHEVFFPVNASYALPFHIGRSGSAVSSAAFGWALGAFVQMALQMIGLRLDRLRISFNWRHPALRHMVLLYIPVMASLLMDILVIRIFSYRLASQTGIDGSLVYMNFATTLIQFPQGLVATAISIAILPTLASQAALFSEKAVAFRDTLGLGIRLATALIIPAALGLMLLADPIIALLFEGGEFTAADTTMTAIALRLYLIGLPFAAIDLLLVYAFYARKDTLTPALIGVFSHVIYIVTVLLLFDRFSLFSLMIADSVKHIVHAFIAALLLRHRIDGFGQQQFGSTLAKTIFAGFAMVVCGLAIQMLLMRYWLLSGTLGDLQMVLLAGGVSGFVYLGVAYLLGIRELHWISALIWERIRPSSEL